MINSMTGYGEAQGEINGVTYAVEIRAVNNRYLKMNIRLPEATAFLEDEIDKLVRNNLSRGTVNYVLRLKDISVDVLFNIDEGALRTVLEKLDRVVSAAGISCPVDIGGLLNLPGVLVPISPDEQTAAQIKELVLRITQEALDKLGQMRAVEGAALAADLDGHCVAIRQGLEQVSNRVDVVMGEYQVKLKKRVDALLASAKLSLDEETLAREVAVFADRSDISEEIARLESHLEQFSGSYADQSEGGEPAANSQTGRKLDFISQEMLREANTIASKASDSEIIRWVVDMKCRIDRIKEQVQNVE